MPKEDFIKTICANGEEWKEAAEYPGYYVSSYGRVVSFRKGTPRLLSLAVMKHRGKDYAHVCLYGKKIRVHRLIAGAFIPNPSGYKEIDHINGDGTDNRVENLRWCDRFMNMNNSETKRRLRISSRSRPQDRGYRDRKVARIKNGVIQKVYDSVRSIKEDGFNDCCVYWACNGKYKTHAGYEWKYIYEE